MVGMVVVVAGQGTVAAVGQRRRCWRCCVLAEAVEGERGSSVVAAAGSLTLFLGVGVAAIDPLRRVDLLADVRRTRVVALESGRIVGLVAAACSLALRLRLGEAAVSSFGRIDAALWRAWWARRRWSWAWWCWSWTSTKDGVGAVRKDAAEAADLNRARPTFARSPVTGLAVSRARLGALVPKAFDPNVAIFAPAAPPRVPDKPVVGAGSCIRPVAHKLDGMVDIGTTVGSEDSRLVRHPWLCGGRDGDWTDVDNGVHQSRVVVGGQADVRSNDPWVNHRNEISLALPVCGSVRVA